MPNLFIGEVRLAPEAVEALVAAGYTVVNEKAPIRPEEDDLTLIAAVPGITSSLRHEVNNPLTAVIGFTQLLIRRPGQEPEVTERLNKVQDHAMRIRDLIQKPGPADG